MSAETTTSHNDTEKMVLNALLQIRSNNVSNNNSPQEESSTSKTFPKIEQQHVATPSNNSRNTELSNGNQSHGNVLQRSSNHNFLGFYPGTAMFPHSTPGFASPTPQLSAAQRAAFAAAAMATAKMQTNFSPHNAALSPESVLLACNGMFAMPHSQGTAQAPLFPAPPATVSPLKYTQPSDHGSKQQLPELAPAVTNAANNKNDDNTEKKEETAEVIRRNEVEAALRSKPQRGRKRENLNVLERMELTRTRNREHAKSTRIRKKARYDELLQCEKTLLEKERLEEVDRKRRSCVSRFINARETMLRCLLDRVNLSPSPASCGKYVTKNTNNLETREETAAGADSRSEEESQQQQKHQLPNNKSPRFVSFDDLHGQGGKADESFPAPLKDIVDNTDEFKFTISGQTEEMGISGISTTAVTNMNALDAKIGSFILRRFGEESIQELGFKIAGGGDDGVAVSKDGVAFARVELTVVVKNGKEERVVHSDVKGDGTTNRDGTSSSIVLLSSIVSLRFAHGSSDKLSSVQWCVVDNSMRHLLYKEGEEGEEGNDIDAHVDDHQNESRSQLHAQFSVCSRPTVHSVPVRF